MRKKENYLLCLILAFILISCQTQASAEKKLNPPKSIKDFRLDDIAKHIKEDPARAIHLLEVYEIIYGPGRIYPDGSDPVVRDKLANFRAEATENLKAAQILAIEEKRWTDAASHARSLSHLGIDVESTGEEPDLLMEYARAQLKAGKNLPAFLAAMEAHKLRSLSFDDAFLFLDKAADERQRRTAAFFLDIINAMGRGGEIPAQLQSYAQGRDTAADMIKGVATVWIDRGIRIQQGRGIPDRVLGSAFFVDASG